MPGLHVICHDLLEKAADSRRPVIRDRLVRVSLVEMQQRCCCTRNPPEIRLIYRCLFVFGAGRVTDDPEKMPPAAPPAEPRSHTTDGRAGGRHERMRRPSTSVIQLARNLA